LHIACQKGHEPIVRYLVDKGIELEKLNSDGCTALYIAASEGHQSIVQYLTENGADIEATDRVSNQMFH